MAQGKSQIEVEIGRFDQEANPDRTFRQGFFYRSFDGLMTLRTVEDLDDMLGDEGLNFGDIFGKTFSGGHGFFQGSGALRAMGKGMNLGFVDSFRGGSVGTLMAFFPAGFLLSSLAGGFLVRWLHARRGRRVILQGFLR